MSLKTVEAARSVFYEKRRDVELRRYDLYVADRSYKEALRLHGATSQLTAAAKTDLEAAEVALKSARLAAEAADATLSNERALYLGGDPLQDSSKVDPQCPLLLFPLRLETKFVAGAKLLVRIYPDTIVSDTHEPALTQSEERAAAAFRTAATRDGEPAAWAAIAAQLGAPRAAWVVRATEGGVGTYDYRSHSWTRAAEARVLPDRFIVRGFASDGTVNTALGALIDEPLALSITPDRTAPLGALAPQLEVDEESRWSFDIGRALSAGMAVQMSLTPFQETKGFARLVVFGVKASMGPTQSAQYLEQLFDSQHYTGGLAFLRQGTPTNNSGRSPSGFGAPDLGANASFALERQAVPAPQDGNALASALGIAATPFERIDRSSASEQAHAEAMNEALFPATVRYFLEQMVNGAFAGAPVNLTPADVDDVRSFFRTWVRGRGPLPAFRVGRVPYGVLPSSSLSRWTVRGGATQTELHLPDLLLRVRSAWLDQVASVPRFDRTGDPDRDLLETLGVDAATQEVRAREATGADLIWNLLGLLGQRASDYFAEHGLFGQAVLDLINRSTWRTRVAGLQFADNADLLTLPFVDPAPLSEDAGLTFNYIDWIRAASVDDLQNAAPNVLLYHLLRHAALTEYGRTALQMCIDDGVATEADRVEPELVKLTARASGMDTVWERMQRSVGPTLGKPLGSWLAMSKAQPSLLASYNAALETLSGLSTAELERLLGETLAVCSHRLDAWITALATQRLADMREDKQGMPVNGIQLGAFGWAESVVPATGISTTTLSDGRVVRHYQDPSTTTPEDYRPGGFVHAPTPDHAAAAAVLRNAYVSRRGEAKGRFALDLSSRRVRLALEVLEEVRSGQHLGAVLGYRFERELHDQGEDVRIDEFRGLFPLVAGKAEASTEPAERIAARNVVDALAMVRARDAGTYTVPSGVAIEAAFAVVDEMIDATSDLLTAESVHQLLRGNTSAASASFDALSRGGRAPDPEFARGRRSGAHVTHRAAVVLAAKPTTAWDSIAATPRSTTEPWLNAWMADLLGDPTEIRCRASFLDAAGASVVREIWLTELGVPTGAPAYALQAYDTVELLGAEDPFVAGSEVERRIKEVVLGAEAAATEITMLYGRDPSWDLSTRSFDEIAEFARAIRRLVAGSRVLGLEDLALPEQSTQATHVAPVWPDINPARLEMAAVKIDLETALDPVGSALELRNALRRASRFGIPSAFPLSLVGAGDAELRSLREQARSVLAEVTGRDDEASGAGDSSLAAKALFGRDFVLLPTVNLPDATEIARALTLGATSSGTASDKRRWFQQSARVREGMARLRRFSLAAGALRGTTLDFEIAQLPAAEGAQWGALPYGPGETRPSRVTGLAIHAPYGVVPDGTWRGLVVDEWVERIPAPAEDTAIALHYDDPGAEAPQALLLAVPPVLGTPWSADALVDTISETLDLAKIRCVDSELLPTLGQFLPAIYLSGNFADDTIVTHIKDLLADPLYPDREL